MDTILTCTNLLLPLVYLAVFIDYGITFFQRLASPPRRLWIGLVLCAHAGFLVLRGIRLGRPPVVSTVEILSVVALATALVYWIVELRTGERRTGVFVFALVFLCQYVSSLFLAHQIASPTAAAAAREARSPWFRIHVVPAVLAYAGLGISAVYGLLHTVARRNLKRARFGLLFDRLPPLERLEKMAWHALLIGFAFLTLVIVTGPLTYHSEPTHPIGLKVGLKIILGSIAWLIYLVAIGGRVLRKWSISRVSGVAMGGFIAIVALLVTSALLS